MIEVKSLTKFYGKYMAIENVNFEVARGEIVGFLGPNGAGKTTTMRVLAGYMPASSGTATVAGFDVFRDSLEVRRRVGYMPETVPLYNEMTVRAYLEFFAELKKIDPKLKKRRVDEAIEECHLKGRAEQLTGKLSKGFRQRVGLAQAILARPEVRIRDAPPIGRDPEEVVSTRRLIGDLGKERTIILSTHILPEVSMVCGKVIVINEGTIVAVDTPENLSRHLSGAERVGVQIRGPVNVNEVLRRLLEIQGVKGVTPRDANGTVRFQVECEPGSDVREAIASTVVGQGWKLLELRQEGMSLEEIFLRLTTSEEGRHHA